MKIYKNLLIIKETYLFYGSCWATDFVDNVFAEGGAMDSLSISSTLIFNDFFEISWIGDSILYTELYLLTGGFLFTLFSV